MVFLGDKNVGESVYINENGAPVEFLIVHKGLPDAMYDNSCNGIWVLRKNALEDRVWDGTTEKCSNDYENSDIKAWLNGEYLNMLDEDIQAAIITVKIPFKKGVGNASTGIYSGSDGLSCKVFLMAAYEVGFTRASSLGSNIAIDGAKLSYFSEESNIRICKNDAGNEVYWYFRSPATNNNSTVYHGNKYGNLSYGPANNTEYAPRPALIFPPSVFVGEGNTLYANSLPAITANKEGSLGLLTDGFDVEYSVHDDDNDTVTVTEILDDVNGRSYEAVPDQTEIYSLRGKDWLKITNGCHTFTISAFDGMAATDYSITFTRNQTSVFVTLDTPLDADDVIQFCSLAFDGVVPTDVILTCEVSNNALDDEPVWEDCTVKVRSGLVYMFDNKFAEKGFAFNFRLNIKRGNSGAGGYITKIYGGFE